MLGGLPIQALAESPAQLLHKARTAIDRSNPAQALAPLAELARTELKPWALYLRGTALQKQGDRQGALKAYHQVPTDSSVSLDARVSVLQLEQESGSLKALDDKTLRTLDQDLNRAERFDLGAELELLKGKIALSRGEPQAALAIFQSLRKKRPGDKAGILAREYVWDIQKRTAGGTNEQKISALLAEASQLITEHEEDLALERTARVKTLADKSSDDYYAALLTEEQALRALSKSA